MITKKARQGRILELVRKHTIRSQEELSSHLKTDHVPVTQSTLSRDIRELGLVKVQGRYQTPGEMSPGASESLLRRTLALYALNADISGNMVAIKTSPGNAHSVCVVLDAAQWQEILGTIAGDDTIFVLARNERLAVQVLHRIRDLLEEIAG